MAVHVMDIVTREHVEELARSRMGPCVSIYQPAPAPPEQGWHPRHTRVRARNFLREAARRLATHGLDARHAERLLQPARRLLDDRTLRPHDGHGVAVFVSPAMIRTFRVPVVEPLVAVDERFHLAPLVASLTATQHFYVLALSLNRTRLFRGTRDDIAELALSGIPVSLRDALQRDGYKRQLQFHTGTPMRRTRRAAVFHGHAPDAKADILRFFRQIDRAVTAVIRDTPAPLVLATVEYLAPIYAAASAHPWLVDAPITGNPERLSASTLHGRACPILDADFDRERQIAAIRYLGLRGTGKTANDVASIMTAALNGRIGVLFAALGPRHCQDALDVAVTHTFLHRGKVYVVPPRQMPDSTSLVALFRY